LTPPQQLPASHDCQNQHQPLILLLPLWLQQPRCLLALQTAAQAPRHSLLAQHLLTLLLCWSPARNTPPRSCRCCQSRQSQQQQQQHCQHRLLLQ
jgi:hypothetical protein